MAQFNPYDIRSDPAGTRVRPGDSKPGGDNLPFQNTGPINANLNLEVSGLRTSGLTSFPAITVRSVHFTLPVVTTPGSYDIRVVAWVSAPDVALISEGVLGVFSVS